MKNYSVPADFKKSSVERWAELNRTSKQSRVHMAQVGHTTCSPKYPFNN